MHSPCDGHNASRIAALRAFANSGKGHPDHFGGAALPIPRDSVAAAGPATASTRTPAGTTLATTVLASRLVEQRIGIFEVADVASRRWRLEQVLLGRIELGQRHAFLRTAKPV